MTNNEAVYDAFEQTIRVGDWVGFVTSDNNYIRSLKGQVVAIGEDLKVSVDTASGYNHHEFHEDEEDIYTYLNPRLTVRTLEWFDDEGLAYDA